MNTNTPTTEESSVLQTPRTDAAQLWHFDEPVVPKEFACALEVEAAFWQAKAHEAEEHEGKQEAEVERLRAKFCRAIEIADKYRERISCVINEDCDWSMHDTHREFNEIKGTLNQDKK